MAPEACSQLGGKLSPITCTLDFLKFSPLSWWLILSKPSLDVHLKFSPVSHFALRR